MNILITGAFGFVGINLSKALSTAFNHHLIAVDVSEQERHSYSEYITWDKLHTLGNKKIDAIIHLAGKAHDTRNTAAEQDYFDINLGLTQKIYEFFVQSGAKKFIFFSSVKAVADTVPGQYLTEETTPSPGTPYGRSKLAAEEYLLENDKQQIEAQRKSRSGGSTNNSGSVERSEIPPGGKTLNFEPGTLNSEPGTPKSGSGPLNFEPETLNSEPGTLNSDPKTLNFKPETLNSGPLFILRPCMIHGPGNKGNLNLLYKLVSKGIPWPLSAYKNRRSFTSVGNLAYVINELLEKNIAPGTYNIADDEPLSTNRLIELIAASKAKKAKIWKINPRIISLAARAGDKMHLPLNSERLKKLTESYVVSNSKIKKALGIQKMPVTAEEGMRETLESF